MQEWREDEDDWPEGHVSRVVFELAPTETGTQLTFTHEDVPEAVTDSIADGWHAYYWQPLRQTFGWQDVPLEAELGPSTEQTPDDLRDQARNG